MVATGKYWFNDNASLSGAKGRGALTLSNVPTIVVERTINETDNSEEYDLVAKVAPSNAAPGYPGQYEQRKRITGHVKDLLWGGKDKASWANPGGEISVGGALSATKIQLIDSADVTLIKEGDYVVLEPSGGTNVSFAVAVVDSIDNDSNAIVLTGSEFTNASAGWFIKVYDLYQDTMGIPFDTLLSEGGLKCLDEKPFAPTEVNVSVISATSVRISWTRPACSNASCFHVYWNSGFNSPDYSSNITPSSGDGSNATGKVLTNLTTDEMYTVTVVSRDSNSTRGYMESRPADIVTFNMTVA